MTNPLRSVFTLSQKINLFRILPSRRKSAHLAIRLQAARTPESHQLSAGSCRSAGEAAGRAVCQSGGGTGEWGLAAAGERRCPWRKRRAAAELHAAAGLRHRASDTSARAGGEGSAESPARARDTSVEEKPCRYAVIQLKSHLSQYCYRLLTWVIGCFPLLLACILT